MIDPILEKFGLSETKRLLKDVHLTSISDINPKTTSRSPVLKHQCKHIHSVDSSHCEENNKLQLIIRGLKSRAISKCTHKGHQKNRIQYLCMENSCPEKFVCSSCFVRKHSNHNKLDINKFITDLKNVNYLVVSCSSQIVSKKTFLKKQLIKQIDQQIANLCDQFHSNLQFFKKQLIYNSSKAIRQIDDYLFQKYEVYSVMKQLKYEQISRVVEIRDKKLAQQIYAIDISVICQNLDNNLKKLESQKFNMGILVKYFEQMNGSMSHFMAQFKKCFPKIYKEGYSQSYQVSDFKIEQQGNSKQNSK